MGCDGIQPTGGPTLGGDAGGWAGLSGVALLPWSAPVEHVEGTPSGRRENVGGTSSEGPADVPIGVPPAWGVPDF